MSVFQKNDMKNWESLCWSKVGLKMEVKNEDEKIETGLKKYGAMVGDNVEVGCNSVLNPGTVVGKDSSIYPNSCVRGVIPANHIFKDKDHVVEKN